MSNDTSVPNSGRKQSGGKPTKKLPTGRINAENQFKLLRGIAIASTREFHPVSNKEIADVVQMHPNTVSIGNPFYSDIGLIEKVGQKVKAIPELVSYADRCKWSQEDAGHKLAPIIEKTWFAKTLLPRLSLHSISIDDAISALAESANASPEFKPQLQLLLKFLEFSGLISIDNNSVSRSEPKQQHLDAEGKNELESKPEPKSKQPNDQFIVDDSFEVFQIPIPGKPSAIFKVPKDLSGQDWDMLKAMLDAYIGRLSNKGD